MTYTVPATEAKNNFGRLIRQARRTGRPIFVESRGRPVAVVLSIEAFERYRQSALDEDVTRARQAFGLWANRDDLDDEWLAQGRKLWASRWGPEDHV